MKNYFFLGSTFFISSFLRADETLSSGESLPHGARSLHSYGFYFPWWGFVLALLGLGLFLFLLSKRGKKKTKSPEEFKNIPLEVLQKLESLEPTEKFSRRDQINFFYELSFNARYYIELKSGLQATDLTFRELKPLFRKRFEALHEKSSLFLKFFEKAEYIKFADKEASKAEACDDRDRVLSLLKELDHLIEEEKKEEEGEEKKTKGAAYDY